MGSDLESKDGLRPKRLDRNHGLFYFAGPAGERAHNNNRKKLLARSALAKAALAKMRSSCARTRSGSMILNYIVPRSGDATEPGVRLGHGRDLRAGSECAHAPKRLVYPGFQEVADSERIVANEEVIQLSENADSGLSPAWSSPTRALFGGIDPASRLRIEEGESTTKPLARQTLCVLLG